MNTNRRIMAAATVAALAAWPSRGRAQQTWPSRPLRWIVAYPPGGGSDFMARLLAQELSASLRQPVVVENRPGASGVIGADAAAKAPGDGYTVLSGDSGTLALNAALFRQLPYDPERDFAPIGTIGRLDLALVVRPDLPVRSVRELLDRARADPGRMTFASVGIGTPHHLAAELFLQRAGATGVHVAYRGAAPAVNDLLAGRVDMMFLDLPPGREFILSGRIRALAVAALEPLPLLPGVPTVAAEAGLPGFEAYAWQALVAPASTPEAIMTPMRERLLEVTGSASVQQRLAAAGITPLSSGADEVRELSRRTREVWVPLVRQLGISLDS
ncbi:Bug family tripartite tricarboxylate transporter substrate binding protein [Muricoccus vinaceus]|uniref:Bug family tripartite tricarboxylate transporter substrate binding protein n=1 Tax=Muricoccus vinaceus TaxID=424704 RepID=A0ABV6IRA5_9PROT